MNVIDAAANLRLVVEVTLNVGAMLLAFIALIAVINGVFSFVGEEVFGQSGWTLQALLGKVFSPLAFLMGVDWSEAVTAGSYIGQKLVINEFVAYGDFLGSMEALSPKTNAIVTFALCGFCQPQFDCHFAWWTWGDGTVTTQGHRKDGAACRDGRDHVQFDVGDHCRAFRGDGMRQSGVGLPQEWIARKRDGLELSREELSAFVRGVTSGDVTEAQIAAFSMAVFFQDLSVEERVSLTLAVRDSGRVLSWESMDLKGPVIDKHSTGGVGDTVSLMLAPMLAACGAYVPMIAGRGLAHTGGTIDKLESIPGYQTGVSVDQFQRVVAEHGFAIVRQTDDLAPADRRMYATRDVTSTVEHLGLITASIVSKKLAAGLQHLVLDVKCGNGAVMQDVGPPELSRKAW